MQSKVPMSEALLEDMILSLDIDYDNNLDYKELAKGLSFWKKERRENRRKQISRESTMDSFKSRSSELIYLKKKARKLYINLIKIRSLMLSFILIAT